MRGTAAQALLDRGFGKPKVEIQNTNADFNEAIEQVRSRLLGHPLGTKQPSSAPIVLHGHTVYTFISGINAIYHFSKPWYLQGIPRIGSKHP